MKARKDLVYSHILAGFSYYSSGRPDMAIHASDFARWCSRRYALCERLGRPYHNPKYLGIGTELVFAIGEKIEEIIAEKMSLVKDDSVDIIRGIYMEKNISGYTLTGSIDIGFMTEKFFIPIEIKSISPEQFNNLTNPKPEHQRQLETYLYLLNKVDLVEGRSQKTNQNVVFNPKKTKAYDGGVIVYVCKTFNQEPIKVFDVEFNKSFDKFIKSIVSELKTSRKGQLPPKVCVHQGSQLAKQCPEVNFCFEEDEEWLEK